MRVAFVGVKRRYRELSGGYRDLFNRFHLELPYYYARASNDVTITTVDYSDGGKPVGSGWLECVTEDEFRSLNAQYDVVVHWRRWFPDLMREGALNLLNCQDHSFSPEWKSSVRAATAGGLLAGVLCFPTWHKRNLAEETGLDDRFLLAGVTLGVDTEIYSDCGHDKDPHQMLWASDPGRGLEGAIRLAIDLFRIDRRFRLHVCQPDYATGLAPVRHPAIVHHSNLDNGPDLWSLFGTSGILPYTSRFKEPSSRAHRQAMAAGCMVLYPPDMGSPSELISHDVNGLVAPVDRWSSLITSYVSDGRWRELGRSARELALSESWSVQAVRFNELCERLREGKWA